MKKSIIALLLFTCSLQLHAQIDITAKPQYQSIEEMLKYAETLVRRPYRSGAEGPYAFDCSGFTRYCFKTLGITLERTSKDQSEKGKRIRRRRRLHVGDLVFYQGSSGKEVGHVGIIIRKNEDNTFEFIHASSSVGITVTSSETSYFSDRYVKAMRVTSNREIRKALKSYGVEVAETGDDEKEEHSRLNTRRRRRRNRNQAEDSTQVSISQQNEELKADKKIKESTSNTDNKKNDKNSSNTKTNTVIKDNNKQQSNAVSQKDSTKVSNTKDSTTVVNSANETLSGKTYTVKKGDTLYNIAKRVPCSVNDLMRMNNMTANSLSIGQILIIRE